MQYFFFLISRRPPRSNRNYTLLPSTSLFLCRMHDHTHLQHRPRTCTVAPRVSSYKNAVVYARKTVRNWGSPAITQCNSPHIDHRIRAGKHPEGATPTRVVVVQAVTVPIES